MFFHSSEVQKSKIKVLSELVPSQDSEGQSIPWFPLSSLTAGIPRWTWLIETSLHTFFPALPCLLYCASPFFFSYKDTLSLWFRAHHNPGWSHFKILNYTCKRLCPNTVSFTGFKQTYLWIEGGIIQSIKVCHSKSIVMWSKADSGRYGYVDKGRFFSYSLGCLKQVLSPSSLSPRRVLAVLRQSSPVLAQLDPAPFQIMIRVSLIAYNEWCWVCDLQRRRFSFRTRHQAWSLKSFCVAEFY